MAEFNTIRDRRARTRTEATRAQLDAEDRVLANDAGLGDRDDLWARVIRETAQDIREHRDCRRRQAVWGE
jgi:hypothetical protein